MGGNMDIYRFALSPWFWLILTVVFSLIELLSSFSLVTIWFALSAMVMIFVSGLTELFSAPVRFRLHIGLFVLIAGILLVFTRPLAVKKLRAGRERTNVDDLAGRDAVVTRGIEKAGTGQVKVRGQIWTAVSEDSEAVAEGTECVILRVEGVKVIVRRKAP
jgi:membrane protein implicated in regulation of membrane protease activity